MLHPPSTREFLHEFIGHYVALEGKLWKSLLLLLFRPGQLTLEYINGRRVRYIQPLRLYLTFSLIFFAVAKYGGHDQVPAPAGQGHAPVAAHGQADKQGGLMREDAPGEIAEGTVDLRKSIGSVNAHWGEQADRFARMAPAERDKVMRTAFGSYVPYAVFLMMPLFALYLKILYLGSGRRYGEHLLFALHVNAFAFLALTLLMVVPDIVGIVSFVLWAWLLLYTPVAMRRVYGGSRLVTGVRWLVLMALHVTGVGVAIGAAFAFGILH
ncbi:MULTISPECIES: DUF3667 domain-containing protein [Massilia]|uniref:DUF3667 domain-containing protein n=1 Tax=Massilia TaxID=149698 RepID=UPI001E31A92B|nr:MULTISPECIES: DUF3667 domain-containing protein [unclassified Massilia]